ncbi:twitching motility protein PilT [Methylobacterium sp. Leaf99]|uniref:type II toxin-antitoxin system VapC family toxin n=1 Tax=Methylobacterium sp. Leaf99 TaxID=1736251 RepID=UPI0006FD158E|nr:type II toxin-antitoxin system VapC family toxin [Methylobacterium sp. Leaf99]KQP07848.1 twitching motility protein PilT [Methylobacterium sp. Leaf99]
MFIDTSAFVAIFCGESDADILATCIERAERRCTSPMVRLETCMVLATRLDRDPVEVQADFDAFLTEAGITVLPIDDGIGRGAVEAFRRYGKGRGHPAQLNLADCLSYACARAARAPILFKGRDFTHTDLTSAL